METKVDRAAGEGRVAIAVSGTDAAIVELKAETDFTAKNDKFISATQKIADAAVKHPAGSVKADAAITAIVDDLRASTGENISLGRAEKLSGPSGTVWGRYVHHDGKTGVLIEAAGVTEDVLKQVAMHITAAVPRPKGVRAEDIPQNVVDKERRFRIEQAMESGKPKEIAEKMVEGGMRKFFAEIALLEQPFIMDPTKPVKDVVGKGTVRGFRRWEVGEQAD
jgi:elongation factor Ts